MRTIKAYLAVFLFSFFITGCEKELEPFLENNPPTVNAGSDVTFDLRTAASDSIRLNGTAADADGTVVGYMWSQVSGPSKSNIITPGAASTYINGLVSGKYEFQLMATDNKGAVGVKSVNVTILQKTVYTTNLPPYVHAGNDTTVTLGSASADSVRLTGSAVDIDGIVAGYLWSQVSGPNTALIRTPGSASTSISGLVAGRYVFQLMAIDEKGATGIRSISVTVHVPAPPQSVTMALQPASNPNEGYIHSMIPSERMNYASTEFAVSAWTNGGANQVIRGLVKFDLSNIPAGARITSAKLSLYSSPYPNSGNQVDANYGANNTLLIQRVLSNWDTYVSWQTQPAADASTQVVIPHTSQPRLDLVDIDVTHMVANMVQSGNYGFLLKLQQENIYTSRIICTSKHADPSKRPKLVLQYTN